MKYDESIQAAVDYIESHLLEEINLELVASQSGYSLSHFYKIFSAITGFTIKEFIRNKRLALAARRLVFSSARVLDIALECGFDSQEVFTRAFTGLFGLSPGKFRSQRKTSVEEWERRTDSAIQIEKRSQRPPFEIPVQAEIIQRGWMHLVGMDMRTSVTYNIEHMNINDFWRTNFLPRIGEIKSRKTSNTTVAYELTNPYDDTLYHMAAVEVDDPPQPPLGMISRSLEPGFYAAFTPRRMLDPFEYNALVRYAFGEWFPMSGCEIRADYSMDLYIQNPRRDGRSTEWQLSVLVPIHPPRRPGGQQPPPGA